MSLHSLLPGQALAFRRKRGQLFLPAGWPPSRALLAGPGYHVQASSLFIGDLDSMSCIHPFLLKAEEVILLHENELDFDSHHHPNGPSPGAVSHPFAHLWCYHLLRRGSLYPGLNLPYLDLDEGVSEVK